MSIRIVYCQLNGHELGLRLDLGAMAALEDHGLGIEELMQKVGSGVFSPKSIRLLLWAMLQGEDPPPSLRDVGRWVDGENFVLVVSKVSEAVRLAFPPPSESPPDPRGGVGTGGSPSASPPAPAA